MKVLLCLMVTIAACNAGLLSGGSNVQVEIQPQHLQHVEQVQHVQHVQQVAPVEHIAPQQQIQIIKVQHIGNGYSGGSGVGYSYNAGHGSASYAQPQIIKVIHEQAAPVGGYAVQGYSNNHAVSYAPNYSSYRTSLESILPQILQIVLGDSNSVSNQLIDVYGTSGRAFITKGDKGSDYLRSGHVVEKGHLEVVKVQQENRNRGGGGGGGLAGLFGGKW